MFFTSRKRVDAVVDAMCQGGIVVVFRHVGDHVGNDPGGNDDIENDLAQGFAVLVVLTACEGFLAIGEQRIGADFGQGNAHHWGMAEVCAAAGKIGFTFFGEGIADAGPEHFSWRFSDDLGVDEGVLSDFWIIIIAEGAVWVVHNTDSGDRSAVAADGWEEEKRFVQFIGDIFHGVASAAAANTEEDICALHGWVGDQGVAIFVGGVATVPDKVEDLNVRILDAVEEGIL